MHRHKESLMLVQYVVPLKKGVQNKKYALKLYNERMNNIVESDIESMFTRYTNEEELDPSVKEKRLNTIDYFRYTKQL